MHRRITNRFTNFSKLSLASFGILLFLLINTVNVSGQTGSNNSLAYLEQTFPKLTNLYKEELKQCRTHYIFAIDVSGSMKKYDAVVTPALQAFAQALPVGEQVSIIPFGTDPKENTPGLCCRINNEAQIQTLNNSLSTLYINEGYTLEFRRNTDVHKAVEAVNKAILNNQEAQMNVVVIITDFLNDLPGIGEIKLKDDNLSKLNKDFDNATSDTYTRVVAMQLPKAGTGKGFCLDQLQESVFCNTSRTKKFDIIQAINDHNAIAHWFNQLSRDIMTEKLKAVIQLDNERSLNASLDVNIDIDGNTTADIRWTPNKLYTQLQIDTTKTQPGSDYYFENNPEAFTITQDTLLENIELGKLNHKNWGLRQCKEALIIGMQLPTEYDAELQKLSIEKPLVMPDDEHSDWIFTFFLPFWWTVGIIIAIILYIMMVIKAFLRNSREAFKGTVDFSDSRCRDIGDTIRINKVAPSRTLLIGDGGNYGCDLSNAEWTIQVVKKTSSPLLFWKRPAFEWSAKSGFVCNGNKKRGLLGRYGKGNTSKMANLECGPDSDKLTHGVKIMIK